MNGLDRHFASQLDDYERRMDREAELERQVEHVAAQLMEPGAECDPCAPALLCDALGEIDINELSAALAAGQFDKAGHLILEKSSDLCRGEAESRARSRIH